MEQSFASTFVHFFAYFERKAPIWLVDLMWQEQWIFIHQSSYSPIVFMLKWRLKGDLVMKYYIIIEKPWSWLSSYNDSCEQEVFEVLT
jgi:hypothetical protein